MAGEGRNHILAGSFYWGAYGSPGYSHSGTGPTSHRRIFHGGYQEPHLDIHYLCTVFMVGTPLMAKLSDRWAGGLSIFWTWPYLGLVLSSPLLHHR